MLTPFDLLRLGKLARIRNSLGPYDLLTLRAPRKRLEKIQRRSIWESVGTQSLGELLASLAVFALCVEAPHILCPNVKGQARALARCLQRLVRLG